MKISAPLVLGLLTTLLAGASQAQTAAPAPAIPAVRFLIPATDDGLPGTGPIRRVEWFQRTWTERRTSFAARAKQDQGALVFLGDSITQGWGSNQAQLFPGLRIANRGISGDTTRGVLIRLQEDVLALNPSGIVLLIGTNDLEEQAAPETIAGNLQLLLAAFKQHNPAMPVVLCSVFPSSETKKRPAAQIRKINQLYFTAIKELPQVTYLDTYTLFTNAQGDAKPEEFPDLLHPNVAGYIKWTAALRPVLETIGLAPAWPDDFTPEPGFESLFNGRDLTGWGYADQPPLDGKIDATDGRFAARNGRLVVTVSREISAYRKLMTTRKFSGDFTLKLEFRCSPNADSGVYIRDPQLQVRDYHLAGPWLTLKNYRPLEWNELVVTVRGGLAHATCNGEILVDAFTVPATGPIGVESDRGQIEYRRIRVKEAK